MTDTEIYQLIAGRISESINEEWKQATAHITRSERSVSFTGQYLTEESVSKSLEANFDFFDGLAIHELHSIITADNISRWNKLEFILFPSGKFEMDFLWDQEFQDELDKYNN